ncbi:lipoprotein [Pseudooceanicola sp. MF1-13]|uniref:LptM family lipoprotein n=1 Tax=Pseudooceanicola sp. MF1-13 TaxID=3379095 RepID=UPI0038920ED9
MQVVPLLTFAGLMALAGCGYTGPIYFTPPASQFAVQVPSPAAQARVQNYVHAEVITLLNGAPVQGAVCGLKSTEVDSGFVTPAMIDLPVYHRPPPPATLTCTYGEYQGIKMIHAQKVAEVRAEPDPRSVEMLVSLLSNAVADSLNMWTYARRGDQIVVELRS